MSTQARPGQGTAAFASGLHGKAVVWHHGCCSAMLLLLLEVNGGSEMACAGWLEGWLEVVNDVLTT